MENKKLLSFLFICFFSVKLALSQITNVLPTTTNYCSGTPIQVDVTVSNAFNVGNIFTLELSDAFGNFSNPISLGTIASTGNTSINGTLPININTGTGYQFRVISSNPILVSPTSLPVTINPTTSVSIADSTLCSNAGGIALNGFPTGGVFSGSAGVIGGYFYPQLVNEGTYSISYSTTPNGCVSNSSVTIEVIGLPIFGVNQTGNVSICSGQTLTLVASSSQSNISYQWQPNLINNDTLLVTNVGTYTVVASNSFGCTATSNLINVVPSNEPQNFAIVAPSQVCEQGNPILLSGIPSGGNFVGNNIIGGFFYPDSSGQYTVTYNFTNSNGCLFVITDTIIVNPLPNVSFSDINPICIDASIVDLSILTSPVGGTFTGTGVSSSGLFNPQLSGSGIFPITYSYSDINQCQSTITKTINVLQLPISNLVLPIENICFNSDSILLTGGSNLGGTYSGNGVVNGYFFPSLVQPGNVTISYTVNNAGNCPVSSNDNIQVYNLTVDAGPNQYIDCGNQVQLNATSNILNNINYSWFPTSNLSNSTIQNPIASPSNTTSYVVTATDGFCSSSDTILVSTGASNFGLEFSSINNIIAPPFNVTFTNNTPNLSNFVFTWDFGDGNIVSSNSISVNHQYIANGTYDVTLYAQNILTGCLDTLTKQNWITTSNACVHSAIINQSGPIVSCSGDSVLLSCTTDALNPMYQWNLNGLPISGQPNSTFYPSQSGSYSVTVFSATGCPQNSLPITVTFNLVPTTPSINPLGNPQFCIGQGSVQLEATGGLQNYIWKRNNEYFGSGSIITAYLTGFYTVVGIGQNGCESNPALYGLNTSFLLPPEMCAVTVDTTEQNWNRNVITWQKPITEAINGYIIYRETNVGNVFDSIAFVDYDSLSEYVDVVGNPNPQSRSYRYRMAVQDTCGSWSLPGSIHKTIHLTVNQGINNTISLLWNNYEGVQFNSYEIRRGTSANNDQILDLLPTSSLGLNSYTDVSPVGDTLFYRVNMIFPDGYSCTPSVKRISASIMAQRRRTGSNIGTNQIFTGGVPFDVGVKKLEIAANNLNVFPNPNKGQFRIEFNANEAKTGEVKIIDILGNVVKRSDYHFNQGENSRVIFANDLNSGVYFLQLNFGTTCLMEKIVIQ